MDNTGVSVNTDTNPQKFTIFLCLWQEKKYDFHCSLSFITCRVLYHSYSSKFCLVNEAIPDPTKSNSSYQITSSCAN